jgi:hypothetical protein
MAYIRHRLLLLVHLTRHYLLLQRIPLRRPNLRLLLTENDKLNVAKRQLPKPQPLLLEAKNHYPPMHPLYSQHTPPRRRILSAATYPYVSHYRNPD